MSVSDSFVGIRLSLVISDNLNLVISDQFSGTIDSVPAIGGVLAQRLIKQQYKIHC